MPGGGFHWTVSHTTRENRRCPVTLRWNAIQTSAYSASTGRALPGSGGSCPHRGDPETHSTLSVTPSDATASKVHSRNRDAPLTRPARQRPRARRRATDDAAAIRDSPRPATDPPPAALLPAGREAVGTPGTVRSGSQHTPSTAVGARHLRAKTRHGRTERTVVRVRVGALVRRDGVGTPGTPALTRRPHKRHGHRPIAATRVVSAMRTCGRSAFSVGHCRQPSRGLMTTPRDRAHARSRGSFNAQSTTALAPGTGETAGSVRT